MSRGQVSVGISPWGKCLGVHVQGGNVIEPSGTDTGFGKGLGVG